MQYHKTNHILNCDVRGEYGHVLQLTKNLDKQGHCHSLIILHMLVILIRTKLSMHLQSY